MVSKNMGILQYFLLEFPKLFLIVEVKIITLLKMMTLNTHRKYLKLLKKLYQGINSEI